MAAYCRICNDDQTAPKSDTYVSCNNCGSFVCTKHYLWWRDSRNAFCTVCFPKQASQAVSGAAGALQAVIDNVWAEGTEATAGKLSNITAKLAGMSLPELVKLLQMLSAELERRNRPGAA